MSLYIHTVLSLLFVSHFNWRMGCYLLSGTLPLSVLLWWHKALEKSALEAWGAYRQSWADMQCAKSSSGCFCSCYKNLEMQFIQGWPKFLHFGTVKIILCEELKTFHCAPPELQSERCLWFILEK